MLQTPVSVSPVDEGTGSAYGGPYRVTVVDDSAVIRGLITRALESDPQIKIVASLGNGLKAVESIARVDTEVMVLDNEMPVMDGITALPKIIRAKPNLKVIMASTLTTKNAAISLRALANGAADYISKPTSRTELHGGSEFRDELLAKVKALGAAYRGTVGLALPEGANAESPLKEKARAAPDRHGVALYSSMWIVLARPSHYSPKILAIGSSTGGPQALFTVLGGLKRPVSVPILIAQHMPKKFTAILAKHIG